jgi:glucose/arabinose dehydrogenase
MRIRDLLQMPDGSLLAIVDDKSGDLLRVTSVTGQRSRD